MKDKDDIMVKDLIKKFKLHELLAIKIMYEIRHNKDKYFRVFDVEE